MLGDFRRWLKERKQSAAPAPKLPPIAREDLMQVVYTGIRAPHVCWESTREWVADQDGIAPELMRRAIMAACLDAQVDVLKKPHARWRTANVEGLAPADGGFLDQVAATAERSFRVLARDLAPLRGDAPIPPVAIVCIEPRRDYFEFTDSEPPEGEEEHVATSGGMYLNEGSEAFAVLAVNSSTRHGADSTIAHELTHHALHGSKMPLFIEEGFTQMMEERVTGRTHFHLDREMVEKHREHWSSVGVDGFLDGSATRDPHGEGQHLAYHLSEWLVRSELMKRPKEFFRFVRECRGREPDEACREVLGVDLRGLVAGTVGIKQ